MEEAEYLVLCFFTNLSNAVALCMMLLSFIEVLVHTGAGIMTRAWLKKAHLPLRMQSIMKNTPSGRVNLSFASAMRSDILLTLAPGIS